jgi:hypothetical protein
MPLGCSRGEKKERDADDGGGGREEVKEGTVTLFCKDVEPDDCTGLVGGDGAIEDGAVETGGETMGGGDGFRSETGVAGVSSVGVGRLSRNPGERGKTVSLRESVGVEGSGTSSSTSFALFDSNGSIGSSKLWNSVVCTSEKLGVLRVGVELRTSVNPDVSSDACDDVP